MKKEIYHDGKIIEITPEFTSVEIISSSACSQCHAKGLCGFSEEESKVVMVPTSPYTERKVGDTVTLALKQTMGLKAVWISYVIPLIILMILVLSLSSVIDNEVWTGLAAIGGVALYYLVIWLLQDKLKNEFVFYIKD
ncbi:MAG: SoxR reducing system RseC family protein [Bacteroidales bacterium]|nr:SoxR reducing system RseC family protein [Bacteroidales bacterium]